MPQETIWFRFRQMHRLPLRHGRRVVFLCQSAQQAHRKFVRSIAIRKPTHAGGARDALSFGESIVVRSRFHDGRSPYSVSFSKIFDPFFERGNSCRHQTFTYRIYASLLLIITRLTSVWQKNSRLDTNWTELIIRFDDSQIG